MEIYQELVERGLIAQVTDEPEIKQLINNPKFSRIFIRKKSRVNIRDSRTVSFAYLYSRIV